MRNYEIENSDRLSKWETNREDDAENIYRKFYVYLFYEDVHTHILPYQSHSNPDYSLNISPNEAKGLGYLSNLFRLPTAALDGDGRHVDYNVEEFIRSAAGRLVCFGQVNWEIVKLNIKVDGETSSITWLTYIPGEVNKKSDSYRQAVTKNNNNVHGEYIDVPRSKVWSVDIPERFGGVNKQRQLIKDLAELSDIMPPFMSENKDDTKLSQQFNLASYEANRFAEMAKLMQTWGWMLSQWQENKTTEYYWVYRQLRFFASLAYLREYIVSQMNILLRRLGTSYELRFDGLPTEEGITSYIEDIKNGKSSFQKALSYIYQT